MDLGRAADLLRRQPSSTVVASDFDGTLSAIVDDPLAARPVFGAVEALTGLAEHYAATVVISGRPVSFLQRWLPAEVQLLGLYGLEAIVDGVRQVHPAAAAWQAAIDDVATVGERGAPPGVMVEHKGLSLTFHFRTTPDQAPEAMAFAEAQAARTGLALRPARMSVELHPPVAVDKGSTLRQVVADAGATAACFIGDDAGDLPAFTALDELADAGLTTVRVAVASTEAPPALLARADVVVDGPVAVVDLLESLLLGD